MGKAEGEWKLLVLPSPSRSARKSIMDKIRCLKLHTRTGSIYVVVNLLNPMVRGWQNYYCHFIKRDLNDLWCFVNRRLKNGANGTSEWICERAAYGSIHCTKCNPVCLPIGVYAHATNCQHRLEEPYESRGSRTVPWGAGGESPLAHSTNGSCIYLHAFIFVDGFPIL